MTQPTPARAEALSLEFPRSLATFAKYSEAQKAVDFLSDENFPVQNVMIVGTDLRQVERVTGRLSWGKVLGGGALSGMWMGLFVGLILTLFEGSAAWGVLLAALLAGAVFGLIWAGLGYSLSRGRRDFTSVSQVVATKYEVLVEHRAFNDAREILGRMPGHVSGLAASASTSSEPDHNPYEGMYGQKLDEEGRPEPVPPHESGSSTSAGTVGGSDLPTAGEDTRPPAPPSPPSSPSM